MQTITAYFALTQQTGNPAVCRDYANSREMRPPAITRGVPTTLNLRLFRSLRGTDPVPLASLSGVASWEYRIAADYNNSLPALILSSDVTASTVTETGPDGVSRSYTQIAIELEHTNTSNIIEAIGERPALTLLVGELTGYDADTEIAWAVQMPGMSILNTVAPSGEPTEPDPSWLNATQVEALVNTRIPSSEKGQANGVPTLGEDGKVPEAQLPAMDYAPAPIVASGAPTTATVGAPGQLYIDTSTNTPYSCVAVTVDDTDPQNPVTTYTWETYIPTSARGAANGVAPLNSNSVVPYANMPAAGNQANQRGGVYYNSQGNYGIVCTTNGNLETKKETTGGIDGRTGNYKPIVASTLDYAVRSVLPNTTTIPAVTTAYSLLDATATTNSHSMTYTHAPSAAPTYTLPAVSSTTVLHEIILEVTFSADVLTYAFQDSAGNAVTPLSTPDIQAGSVIVFLCRYSSAIGNWYIVPIPVGSVPAQA